MGNVICLVFAYGVIIAFNLVSPFLFLDIFHVSAVEYGKLLLLLGFSYFFGASINSQALKSPYLTTHKMIIMGLICLVIASIGLEILNFIGLMNVKIIMGSFSLGLIGVGFIYPNCFANALEVFPNNSYSCAFIGSAILVGISVIGMFITHLNHRNCISYVFLILTALSIITYLFTVLIKERSNLT
jgi:DHA1 family 2-module integral membrane pump EmrD-like MFS transporter